MVESYREARREIAIFLFLFLGSILVIACYMLMAVLEPYIHIPKILRFYALAIAATVGIAIFASRGMKEICSTEEELLWGYSALVSVAVTFIIMTHIFYLVDSKIMTMTIDGFSYMLVALFSGLFPPLFLSFEILESRKVKRRVTLRIKRLFGRFWFIYMFVLVLLLVIRIFSSFSTDDQDKLVLYAGVIFVDIILLIVCLQFKGFTDFINDLWSGNW